MQSCCIRNLCGDISYKLVQDMFININMYIVFLRRFNLRRKSCVQIREFFCQLAKLTNDELLWTYVHVTYVCCPCSTVSDQFLSIFSPCLSIGEMFYERENDFSNCARKTYSRHTNSDKK